MSEATTNMLEVDNLSKRFGGLVAVDDISFNVVEGEILGLIGPNGSGKTTLFNCIMSKLRPTSGKVTFKQEEITNLPTHKIVQKGLSVVTQESNPIGEMTVKENIELFFLPNNIRRSRKKVELPKIRKAAERFNLGDELDTTADALPHLDVRRLELAKALATDPDFILIDEPFAGLNKAESEELGQQIKDIQTTNNMGMVVVDHNVTDLLDLVDRVVVLDNGKKIQEGTPEFIADSRVVQEAYLGGEGDDV